MLSGVVFLQEKKVTKKEAKKNKELSFGFP
jgi:hypothetical protein